MFRGTQSGIDFWLENGLAYVGSPETVIQRIREAQSSLASICSESGSGSGQCPMRW